MRTLYTYTYCHYNFMIINNIVITVENFIQISVEKIITVTNPFWLTQKNLRISLLSQDMTLSPSVVKPKGGSEGTKNGPLSENGSLSGAPPADKRRSRRRRDAAKEASVQVRNRFRIFSKFMDRFGCTLLEVFNRVIPRLRWGIYR